MTNVDIGERVIRAQPGKQEDFLATSVDVALYGGSAGGGKSYGLLLEAGRNTPTAGYYGVIFRRTTPMIRNEGSLWDESQVLYRAMGGYPRETTLEWRFKNHSRIRFAHMEYEKTKYDWHGSQLVFVGFDELCQFTRGQFWYMFSRLRSACGIPCYVRATCNPDPDSFVAELVEWYINPATGYAIPERSGAVRYFARLKDDALAWGDSKEEIANEYPHLKGHEDEIKSFTFISSNVDDNQIMLADNPSYKSNLKAMSLVDRERLLHGNWHIRPSAGTIFRRDWFPIVSVGQVGGRVVRYWDRAATEPSSSNPDPDWTVGCRMRKALDGMYYVEDVVRFRGTPNAVKNRIRNVATQDPAGTEILLARDPGQAGKAEVQHLISHLAGFKAKAIPETKAKIVRANAPSAQVEAGNVKIVGGSWNRVFLDELESFGSGKGHDDQADAFSGAMNALMVIKREPRASWL